MRKRIPAMAAMFAATLGLGLGATSTGAHAATIANNRVYNVSVTSRNAVKIHGWVTGTVQGMGYDYEWALMPSRTDWVNCLGYVSYDGFWDTWYADAYWSPGYPLGTYHAYPTARATVPETTTTFYVRQGSKLALTTGRSGRYVTLTAKATYYRVAAGAWRLWAGHGVAVQKKVGGTWKTVKYAAANKAGAISVRAYSPAAANWRAQDSATGTIWGATSASVRR
jgi:hypothetical protein